jgi:hypothetical protein
MTPLSIGISVVVNSATYLTRLAGMPSEEDAREARAPAAVFIADARRQAACTASHSLMRREVSRRFISATAHPAASEGIGMVWLEGIGKESVCSGFEKSVLAFRAWHFRERACLSLDFCIILLPVWPFSSGKA